MRPILILLLLTGSMACLFAQVRSKNEKLDSLRLKLMADSTRIYRHTLAKPYLRIENRYSFISKRPVNLIGFMAGATFVGKHIVSAGYYVLNRFTKESIEIINENNVVTREYLSFNYFVLSYQYVLLNKRFLQIQAPLEIGYGPYSTRTTDNLDVFLGKSTGNIIPISAGIQFIFKPIRWLGISTVGGYRHAIQEKNITIRFTGFYYSFGVWIDARHVFRATRYHFKKKKYREEAAKVIS